MTKKRIGELKGKPIVQGDPNLITNNQILYKESEGKVSLFSREDGELVPLTASSMNGFLVLRGTNQNNNGLLSVLNIDDLTFSTPEETIKLGFEPFIKRIELDESAGEFSDGIPVYKVIIGPLKQNALDHKLYNCTFPPNLLYYASSSSGGTSYLISEILRSTNEIETGDGWYCFVDTVTRYAYRIEKLVYDSSIEDFTPILMYILIFDAEYDN